MALYTGLIIAGAGLILIPGAPLIGIMLVSQVINGILLPFVLIFILLLVNNRELMGEHVNGRVSTVCPWLSVLILIVLTVSLLTMTVRQMIAG